MSIPDDDQFEICVIGTGGGYGESILVHVGKKDWIIVDSCKDPNTGKVLPIEYLETIGVNVEEDVKLIICTHWDDDHIRGLSFMLSKCKMASLCISMVSDQSKFLQMVSLDHKKLSRVGSMSSTKELMECLKIMCERDLSIVRAVQDKILYASRIFTNPVEVISLSPSDESIRLFDYEVSRLIDDYGSPSAKLLQTQNQKSVVLLLKLGTHRAILGSDLEVTGSNKTGWECVLANSNTIDGKASYFKIPHHGSKNGYHIDIWNSLLTTHPEATLTPWNKNKKLPVAEMVEKYKGHTPNLYITSNISPTKAKRRDPDMEKVINRFNSSIREVRFYRGMIRSRIKVAASKWTTVLFDSAAKL